MKDKRKIVFVAKVLLIGLLVAVLVYLLHSVEGLFSMVINGEQVTDQIAQFAGLPILFVVLFFTVFLSVLAFLGVGLFLFLAALIFTLLGVFMLAPYAWPLLLVVFIIILIVSFGETKNS